MDLTDNALKAKAEELHLRRQCESLAQWMFTDFALARQILSLIHI